MPNPILISLVAIVSFIWLEIKHRLRPSSPLRLWTHSWEVNEKDNGVNVKGWLEIHNPHQRMEVMVPQIQVTPVLLGKTATSEIEVKVDIAPKHPDEESRTDGYWQAYIVKSRKSTKALINLHLEDSGTNNATSAVENIWLDINWINYGPFGLLKRREGLVIPIDSPQPLTPPKAYFQAHDQYQLLPIKTHMLGALDDSLGVINRYASQLVQPGDILTIGETPLAIMQGRYHNPESVVPNFIARNLCRAFHPTSSLATACGLQSLIDIVGPSRVIVSWVLGSIGKIIGIKGLFYRLAGEQARLIDDITGTTPPYDQTIVLGPVKAKDFCDKAAEQLGISVAVVDVNDLGRVKILASSKQCNKKILRKALNHNPAGNANQRTPIVLVRPSK